MLRRLWLSSLWFLAEWGRDFWSIGSWFVGKYGICSWKQFLVPHLGGGAILVCSGSRVAELPCRSWGVEDVGARNKVAKD